LQQAESPGKPRARRGAIQHPDGPIVRGYGSHHTFQFVGATHLRLHSCLIGRHRSSLHFPSGAHRMPDAIFPDLDDTILRLDAGAAPCRKRVTDLHAAELWLTPEHLLSAIDRTRTWYWSDPGRHREGRLNYGSSSASHRRAGVGIPRSAAGGSHRRRGCTGHRRGLHRMPRVNPHTRPRFPRFPG
jgi:hypothetical protein